MMLQEDEAVTAGAAAPAKRPAAAAPVAALAGAALATTYAVGRLGAVQPIATPIDGGAGGVVVNGIAPGEAEASRFLAQATMGATRASIAEVVAKGYAGWLDAQFATARQSSLWDDMVARGYSAFANINETAGYDAAVWRQLITAPDQLRMRVGTALLDFLVVGMPGLATNWIQFHCAGYLDTLLDGAFGTWRALIEKVTLNPAMATYLSSINNKKANPVTGAQPDENFPRELMQLFTLGLYQLNMDGSVKTAGGVPLETYTQRDVTQLARIFTGLMHPDGDWHTHEFGRKQLVVEPAWNDAGAATVLGRTFTGGGMAAIRAALDHICAHPNVPPFVSRQLIQRLVTSNPSPAYVQRVATVFADNGAGVRGDLKAVIRAILLDTEARGPAALSSTTAGRVRTPVQRLTAWARAFGAVSASDRWAIGNTASQATGIGQSTGQAPSVFNFFRPGYAPPGALATQKLVAPELQIANEQSIISYVNVMHGAVSAGIDDVKTDYAALAAKAGDAQALVDEVNLLLAAGQLSPASLTTIRNAVDGVAEIRLAPIKGRRGVLFSLDGSVTGGGAGAGNNQSRIWTAILLTLAAPEFLVTR